MFKFMMRCISWLCILVGSATAIYASYAILSGRVVVSSRGAGTSIYEVSLQTGPFLGFVLFYFVCATVFIAIGFFSMEKKDKP